MIYHSQITKNSIQEVVVSIWYGSVRFDDLKERALAQAIHKPQCWFCYVDDTFVIWPHRTDKLERFLNHLNGLHRNIKFTIRIQEDSHLPFLDIDIYRRPDGSLDHKVYRKPIHNNLYMNPWSLQHTSRSFKVGAHSQGPLRQGKPPWWVGFLKPTFRENFNSIKRIWRALNPAVRTSKQKQKPTSVTLLPHVQMTYGRLSRMLAKQH